MRLGHADGGRAVVGAVAEAQPFMVPAGGRYRRQLAASTGSIFHVCPVSRNDSFRIGS
jgi:hypothetical protein